MRRISMVLVAVVAVTLVTGVVNRATSAPSKDSIAKLMQKKLTAAQAVLEGLAMEDFDAIGSNAKDIGVLTQQGSWKILQTPDYVRLSAEFYGLTERLEKHARDRNLDGATLTYVEMTLVCVNCHKHVRSVRVADLNLPAAPTDAIARR